MIKTLFTETKNHLSSQYFIIVYMFHLLYLLLIFLFLFTDYE